MAFCLYCLLLLFIWKWNFSALYLHFSLLNTCIQKGVGGGFCRTSKRNSWSALLQFMSCVHTNMVLGFPGFYAGREINCIQKETWNTVWANCMDRARPKKSNQCTGPPGNDAMNCKLCVRRYDMLPNMLLAWSPEKSVGKALNVWGIEIQFKWGRVGVCSADCLDFNHG